MSEPILNLITSPDKLFNDNPSLLLVNPSDSIKENFNQERKKISKCWKSFYLDI